MGRGDGRRVMIVDDGLEMAATLADGLRDLGYRAEALTSSREAAARLSAQDIICNMNMLPHEAPTTHNNPEGIRIGVQEMTRFGMGKEEMRRIAELMKECLIDGKNVKQEVNRFRLAYQDVKYSFDDGVSA